MKNRKSVAFMLLMLFSISVFISLTDISADFQPSSEDVDKWSKSVTSVAFSKDNYLKLNLAIADETGEYALVSYLSFHTILNLPLEVVSYLNHNKGDQTADYGLQVQTTQGNFSLGVNGTIIVDTPFTGPVFIEIEEGEQETIADFSSFLGENVTIPVNFIPFVFPIDIEGIPGITGISLIFAPSAELNASSSLEARVMDQDLVFTDSQDVYINTFPVSEDFTSFNTEMRDIYLDIDNVTLFMKTINLGIVVRTDLGDIRKNFAIDLSSIDTSVIMDPIGEILLLYVSSTFYLGDLSLNVVLDSASFAFISLLIAIVVFASFAYWRKRKK
ncbi:MAG: hypothetical protein GOP50_09325 [Candidatus Heimdallarchaeota archaeon]|nr:hypothetical protein [Candidatus Heimdallarchaeota archaeon]